MFDYHYGLAYLATWVRRVPAISWLVVCIAIASGFYAHAKNPYGIFVYTPRDVCSGASSAFAIGYLIVLILGVAACVLAVIAGWLAWMVSADGEAGALRKYLVRAWRPAIASLVLFLVLMPAGDFIGGHLPLKIDPRCLPKVS